MKDNAMLTVCTIIQRPENVGRGIFMLVSLAAAPKSGCV